MHKDFEKLFENVEAVKTDREKQIEELSNSCDNKHNDIAKLNEDILTSTIEGNAKLYKDSKKKREEAASDLELFQGRLSYLSHHASVTDQECQEFLNRVYALQDKKYCEYIDRLAKLLVELNDISAETSNYIADGNAIIEMWGREVKPFMKQIGMKDGEPYCVPVSAAYEKATDCMRFIHQITNHEQYRRIVGGYGCSFRNEPIFKM